MPKSSRKKTIDPAMEKAYTTERAETEAIEANTADDWQ